MIGRSPAEAVARAAAPDSAAPSSAADALPPAIAGTILLAEDEHQVRKLLARALQQHGYSIIAATNGREALELSRVHNGRIHLLLTDVVMPVMGGREAAAAIRLERPDIRVVFMSGYSEELVRLQAELTETAAFIAKPFTPDELRRVIRDVLTVTSGQ